MRVCARGCVHVSVCVSAHVSVCMWARECVHTSVSEPVRVSVINTEFPPQYGMHTLNYKLVIDWPITQLDAK